MNNKPNRYFSFSDGAIVDLDRIIAVTALQTQVKGSPWAISFEGTDSTIVLDGSTPGYDDRPALVDALLKWGERTK